MKKNSDLKKKQLESQIQEMKLKISSKMLNYKKKGILNICMKNDTKIIDEYCEINLKDKIEKLNDCKKIKNFCLICCETEFGEFYLKERNECKSKCRKEEIGTNSNGCNKQEKNQIIKNINIFTDN